MYVLKLSKRVGLIQIEECVLDGPTDQLTDGQQMDQLTNGRTNPHIWRCLVAYTTCAKMQVKKDSFHDSFHSPFSVLHLGVACLRVALCGCCVVTLVFLGVQRLITAPAQPHATAINIIGICC